MLLQSFYHMHSGKHGFSVSEMIERRLWRLWLESWNRMGQLFPGSNGRIITRWRPVNFTWLIYMTLLVVYCFSSEWVTVWGAIQYYLSVVVSDSFSRIWCPNFQKDVQLWKYCVSVINCRAISVLFSWLSYAHTIVWSYFVWPRQVGEFIWLFHPILLVLVISTGCIG
jgi:hypothetical protein